MAHALANLVEIEEDRDLTKHEFFLPLCGILQDLVKQDIDGPDALTFSEIAYSLAHDVLNLAVLAGRILWCEGVTANMERSPDLVAIAVDTENYFVLLRTAYDILAKAIVHFGVEPRDRGKIPSDSFNRLKNWIKNKKNPDRINKFHESFRFFVDHFDRFEELKDLRDDIIHHGQYSNIYTDRTRFRFFLMPSGVAEFRLQRRGNEEGDQRKYKTRSKQVFLLPFLQQLTNSLFELITQLSQAIEVQCGMRGSRRHVLSGEYVPALHHLLSYEAPPERNDQIPDSVEERRRDMAAWYLLNAGDYLGAVLFGYPDGYWWRFMMRISELFPELPKYFSPPKFGGARDAIVHWEVVFRENGKNFALLLRDNVLLDVDWLTGVNQNIDNLSERAAASRTILVANKKLIPKNSMVAEESIERFLIEADPIVAAEMAFQILNQSPSECA
jgi:hypothetical protein